MQTNPFTPVFGNEPPILAGRNRYIDDVVTGLDNSPGDPNRIVIFTGPRGSGKTVLLAKISEEAMSRGWIAVHASALPGLLDLFIEQTIEKAQTFIKPKSRSRITGIQAAGFGVTREPTGEPRLSWRTEMGRLLDELNSQGIGLMFTVDEVHARESAEEKFP